MRLLLLIPFLLVMCSNEPELEIKEEKAILQATFNGNPASGTIHDFGNQPNGTTSVDIIIDIKNVGNKAAYLKNADFPTTLLVLNCDKTHFTYSNQTSRMLQPGETTSIGIAFSPFATGTKTTCVQIGGEYCKDEFFCGQDVIFFTVTGTSI